MTELDNLDKEILKLVQDDLPDSTEPFRVWAGMLGTTEDELIERIRRMKASGIIREFKAILRHKEAGIKCNAMVVWAVSENEVERIGSIMADNIAVTHCYERPDFGEYNLFTMIHGKTGDDISEIIKQLSTASGIDRYKIFQSIKELKKTSMKYF